MKTKNGITLIALIISIIVMLILVGVTVTVAINGGLFEKAKDASKKTLIEREKEELTSAIAATYNVETGKVDKEKLKEALSGWKFDEEEVEPYTVTSAKGNIYKVAVDGTITLEKEEETPGGNPIELPEGLNEGDEIEIDADKDGTPETWIVLYKNLDNIEVISKNAMGELELGKNDTEAINKAIDINENNKLEDIEKSIYSYNNAIDRINKYCASLIKIPNDGVRSVGSLPSNPSYKNSKKPATVSALDKWSNKTAWETYGVLGEIGENNYKEDWNKMSDLSIEASDKEYWLASRKALGFGEDEMWYVVNYVEGYSTEFYSIWSVDSNGNALCDR